MPVGAAEPREEHGLAADLAARDHDAERRALDLEGLAAGGRLVGRARAPLVRALHHLDFAAAAAEAVVRLIAERDRERIDDVLRRGGRAPRVVAAMADLHEEVDAGEGDAARVVAGRVNVLLNEDLRREVGRLRSEDGQRPAGLRLARRHDQRVRLGARERQQLAAGRRSRRLGLLEDLRHLHRAAVGDRGAPAMARVPGVGEALGVNGGRALGVVHRAEVAPDPLTPAAAEALARSLQRERRLQLLAAADAEDRARDSGGGDHVRGLEVVRPVEVVDRGVLAGHLRRVHPRLRDVLVHAGEVGLELRAELVRLLLEPARADLGLAGELLLGVGGDGPHQRVERPVGGRAAGERGELPAAEVAEDVHEEEPVLGGGVPDAEHGALARVGVDVGDAELLVAGDRDVVARAVGALGGSLDAEARVLEERVERGGVERARRGDQVAVERELVARVLGADARGQEGAQLDGVREATRPGREQVADAAGVVGPVGLRLGRGRSIRGREYGNGEGGRRELLRHRSDRIAFVTRRAAGPAGRFATCASPDTIVTSPSFASSSPSSSIGTGAPENGALPPTIDPISPPSGPNCSPATRPRS